MADYKMTAKELILTSGSSRGSQIKFFKDNYWYKIDESGPEGKAEELASRILVYSNIRPEDYLPYESCTIEYNGKVYNGCRSENFLKPGEQLFSYEKIYNMATGKSLTEDITMYGTPKERIDYTVDAIEDFSGIDVSEHISKILTVSMILMDTDKHLNNFGIIADKELASFRNAPIFDNGAAFLSNYTVYPPSITINDIEKGDMIVTGKPFSGSLEYQAYEAGYGVRFDFDRIRRLIDSEPESRMKQFAQYAIDKYSRIPQLQCARSDRILSDSVNPVLSKAMETVWFDYFTQPNDQKSGVIQWDGRDYRLAEFTDMYLGQCQKDSIPQNEQIRAYFQKTCIDWNEYEPRFCTGFGTDKEFERGK